MKLEFTRANVDDAGITGEYVIEPEKRIGRVQNTVLSNIRNRCALALYLIRIQQ